MLRSSNRWLAQWEATFQRGGRAMKHFAVLLVVVLVLNSVAAADLDQLECEFSEGRKGERP